MTGTAAAAEVVPRLAAQLLLLRDQRRQIEAQVERLVEDHPLSPVLTSMPGVGVRTATRILTEVVGKDFPTAGHLAAYAGSPRSPAAPGAASAANTPHEAVTGA